MIPSSWKALPPALLAVMLLGACGDAHPVATEQPPAATPNGGPPLRSMTEQDAFSIADPYYRRDVLAPFGSNYDAFFDDPESITDAQFEAQGPYSVQSWEVDPIEADAAAVNDYCESVSGGASPDPFYTVTDGEATIASWLSCEDKWIRCWQRCRRLPAFNKPAKALCWGGCAASYALCVRRRGGG